jgi:phage/plasmid-like protein (TIGR03299 family)
MSAPIDVNDRFATAKVNQLENERTADIRRAASAADRIAGLDKMVADGKARVSGDTYTVTEGWDAGETFTVNRNAATGELIEVTANTGLDTLADGSTALYLAGKPAWHALGQVIPEGTSDIEEALRLSGNDFTVAKIPASFTWDGETREHPGRFVTVRTDTGAPLGAVGAGYTPTQNTDAFGFLQELVGDMSVTFESAGTMRNGASVFVSLRLPQTVTIDPEGINDEIVPFVMVRNTHDGTGSFQAMTTPWRPLCKNTEGFAVRDAQRIWKIRHTAGITDRVKEARRALGMSVTYFEAFAAEETALAHTDIALNEFQALLDTLWTPEEDTTKKAAVTIAAKRTETLMGMFGTEAGNLGRTAYAAERAITDYLDHVAPKRPGKTMTEEIARASALLLDTDGETKTKAHRQLMTLTNR